MIACGSTAIRAGDGIEAEVTRFVWNEAGEKTDVIFMITPAVIRIDHPQHKFAALVERETLHVRGLEIRDALWWEFSWPEIAKLMKQSVRALPRFDDVNIEGHASVDLARPMPPREPEAGDEEPKFLWKPTGEQRTLGGRLCERWIGSPPGGDDLDAWVADGSKDNPIAHVLSQVMPIYKPLDLVVLRPILAPQFVDVARALEKTGQFPMRVEWGPRGSRSQATWAGTLRERVAPEKLSVPKTYRKTTLKTIESLTATGDEPPPPPASRYAPLEPIRAPEDPFSK
jgi:hypothetical protein